MAGFDAGEALWIERLGNLRNVVRQEMIGRQLADHVRAGTSVLDVGCGQGTQALRLAGKGCSVTGIEPSAELRQRCAEDARSQGLSIELVEGRIEDGAGLVGGRRFDLVCAHGLLMYLGDRRAAIAALARCVAPGGRLSITFRNGHALAMRPGLRRDWAGAIAAFDSREYVNELGVVATADRLEDVQRNLAAAGMCTVAWYGVRVFNDAVSATIEVPAEEDLPALLDAEDQAGRRDPYRWLGSQIHIVAEATDPP